VDPARGCARSPQSRCGMSLLVLACGGGLGSVPGRRSVGAERRAK
jgi:hypothetical protein